MRLLLDTHTFLWWLGGSERLSAPARRAIADEANEVLISAASAWEIATKHRLGKLAGAELLVRDTRAGIAATRRSTGDASRLNGPLRGPVPCVP